MYQGPSHLKIGIIITAFTTAIVIIVILMLLNKSSTPNPQVSQTVSPKTSALSVSQTTPSAAATIPGGTLQSFSVTFNQPVKLVNIEISLASLTSNNQLFLVEAHTTIDSTNTVITINPSSPLSPFTHYYLIVVDIKTRQQLLKTAYYTSGLQPTPIPQNNNNPALQAYLPYTASDFSLSYDTQQNIYIFVFKYNPTSTESATIQLNNAKAEMMQWVAGKGIDFSTLHIQYQG